jgi:hypothetical protein
MKIKSFFLLLVFIYSSDIICQKSTVLGIEYGRSLTTYGDLRGERLTVIIGMKSKNILFDINFSISNHGSKDDAYFQLNSFIIDKEFNNFPIQNDNFKNEHLVNLDQNKGFYSKFGSIFSYRLNILDLGMSRQIDLGKFRFVPRIGVGSGLIDNRFLVIDYTSKLDFLGKNYPYTNMLIAQFKFYDVDVNLGLTSLYKIKEDLYLGLTLRSDTFVISKHSTLLSSLALRVAI